MPVVNIPNPCSEDFSKMTPAEKGFHCASCQKVVVDFRSKSDEEIATFLQEHKGEKTCGRFRVSQVVKHRTFSFQIVRFAAALLLVFGSFLFTGCHDPEPELMGDICVSDSQMFMDSMEAEREYQLMRADSARKADTTK